jgi:hypothetical protein
MDTRIWATNPWDSLVIEGARDSLRLLFDAITMLEREAAEPVPLWSYCQSSPSG